VLSVYYNQKFIGRQNVVKLGTPTWSTRIRFIIPGHNGSYASAIGSVIGVRQGCVSASLFKNLVGVQATGAGTGNGCFYCPFAPWGMQVPREAQAYRRCK
jgi:hypothetical protein